MGRWRARGWRDINPWRPYGTYATYAYIIAIGPAFIRDEVNPVTLRFFQLGEGRANRWSWAPGQLELLDGLKANAKAEGLWNRASRP